MDLFNDQDIFSVKVNEEELGASICRMIKYFKILLEMASKCYFAIKLELHFKFFAYIFKASKNMSIAQRAREFSSTNISDFYQELYRFYTNLS